MGERITGGGAVGKGMHAEKGSEGKNGHMWMNECTELVCKNIIKTINHQNKDHIITHLSFRDITLHHNSLKFDIGLYLSRARVLL